MPNHIPTVHVLCAHSAGTAQMALGFFNHLAAGRALGWVDGDEPAAVPSSAVIAAMAEVGVDISDNQWRQPWTPGIPHVADVAIATDCAGTCSRFLANRYQEWNVTVPPGPTAAVRPVRNEIERRVRTLITSLDIKVNDNDHQLAILEDA